MQPIKDSTLKATFEPKNNNRFACDQCFTGVLHCRRTTFFATLGDEVITVPNFPIWKCDICGWVEYEPDAIEWLLMTLGSNFVYSTNVSSIKNTFFQLNRMSWMFW